MLPDVKTPIDWFLSSRAEICVTPVGHADMLPFSNSHGKALGARVCMCACLCVCMCVKMVLTGYGFAVLMASFKRAHEV